MSSRADLNPWHEQQGFFGSTPHAGWCLERSCGAAWLACCGCATPS